MAPDSASTSPFLTSVAFFDLKLGQMKIHGEQPAAVIEHHAAAGEEKISHQDDAAMIGRDHFGSRRRRQIRAAVRSARRAVDDAARSKGGRRRLMRHGTNERRFPKTLRYRGRKGTRERRLLAANFLEGFRSSSDRNPAAR